MSKFSFFNIVANSKKMADSSLSPQQTFKLVIFLRSSKMIEFQLIASCSTLLLHRELFLLELINLMVRLIGNLGKHVIKHNLSQTILNWHN